MSKEMQRNFLNINLKDSSILSLLAANIIIIVFSIIENWSLKQILWIYWGQSVIVGFFHFCRILSLTKFSTKNFKLNSRSVLPTMQTKIQAAAFFAFHYGFFHFIYAIFLGGVAGAIDIKGLLTGAAIFFINHFYSFRHNLASDKKNMKNIGTLFFMPYARIIPMHLIIVMGFLGGGAIGRTVFLSLKTVADVTMHSIKHKE